MSSRIGDAVARLRAFVPSILRRRFAYKLATWMLAVVVLVALVGGVGYIRAQETVGDNTERQMQSTAALQSDSVEDWARAMRDRTSSLATDAEIAGDATGAQNHLNRQSSRYKSSIRDVHVVDVDDEEFVASTSTRPMAEHDEPWNDRELLSSLSRSVYDVETGESYEREFGIGDRVVYFVTPVLGAEDRAVVLIAPLEYHVGSLHQPFEGQRTSVLDGETGRVLVGEEEFVPAQLLEDEGSIDGNQTLIEGESNVYTASPISGTEWTLVTTVPKEQAFATASLVGESMLLVIGVALVGVLAVTAVIGRGTAVPITRLRDKARTMESGDLDVDFRTSRIDEIGQLYGGFAAMRDALDEQIRTTEAARASAERTNEHLERKADEYSAVMRSCGEGDLTARMDPESENESMEAIGREFNEMIAAIEETVAHLSAFATDVATASEQVTASSEEVRYASEQVSTSVQRIAAGAERQYEDVAATNAEIDALSSTTEEIASLSNEVAGVAERTAQRGAEGRETANEATEDMNAVVAETDATAERFERLREEIERVDELTAFIEEIAKRTNVLALNANIEASRSAGDDGDGFGVVAREVKDLSGEIQDAAETIQRQLADLLEEADEAAAVVDRTSDQVAAGVDSVEEIIEALEDIATYAERTNRGVQEISDATADQASSASEVAGMVDGVAKISEETMEESESVAASAEEQTSSLAEVSESASALAHRAAELNDGLGRFEIDVDADVPLVESNDRTAEPSDQVSDDESATDRTFRFDEDSVESGDVSSRTDSTE